MRDHDWLDSVGAFFVVLGTAVLLAILLSFLTSCSRDFAPEWTRPMTSPYNETEQEARDE